MLTSPSAPPRRTTTTHPSTLWAVCSRVSGSTSGEGSAASAYEGGLYVQAVPGVPSRRYVQLEAGDALLHRFDTMHGVHVPSGERLPLNPL